MKVFYPDERGIPCCGLPSDDPLVAALRFRLMRLLYQAGYDVPIQSLWLGGCNGGMLAFAEKPATYGLLMLSREHDSWQVELLVPFGEPLPAEQPARAAPSTTMQPPYPIDATESPWFQRRARAVLEACDIDDKARLILLGPESHLIVALKGARLCFFEVQFTEHEEYEVLASHGLPDDEERGRA